jgi:hypothetical protein
MRRRQRIRSARLVMSARHAASRFLLDRGVDRGLAWLPAVLFWRRKRKPVQPLRISTRTGSNTVWATHLHLHFHLRGGESARHPSSKHSAPGTTGSSRGHLVLHRSQTNTRTIVAAGSWAQPSAALQKFYRHNQTVSTGPRSIPASPRVSGIALPTRLARRIPLLEERTQKRVAAQTETTFARTTSRVNTTRHHHNLRELRFRTLVTKQIPVIRSDRAEVPQRKRAHPPELIWRRPVHRPDDVRESRSENQAALLAPNIVRSQRAPDVTVDVQPATPAPLTAHAATLDPGLMDRLTDDVIRRVERRIRIERERRGL